jgi:hypothetical protein
MPAGVAYALNRFVLRLDGFDLAVRDVDGGHIKGEVARVDTGPGLVSRKQIVGFTIEPFTVGVGLSMGTPMLDWLQGTLGSKSVRKDGSIVTVDASLKAQQYRHFTGALIEEVTFPALDGANKEAGFFTVKFRPERIRYEKGDGAVIAQTATPLQKAWIASNFRFELGGLPCNRVSRIESFTIKQTVSEQRIGTTRDPLREPRRIEYPNLTVTLSAVDVDPWQTWLEDFVVKGNSGQDRELTGRIEFLDASLTKVLATVELLQVGIVSLRPDTKAASTESMARYVVEMYVESIKLTIKA